MIGCPIASQNIVDHPVLVVVDEQPDHRRANRRDDGRDVENRPEGRPRDDFGVEQGRQQEGHRHAEGHADAHIENGVVNDGPETRVVGEDLREVAEADPDGRLDQVVPREAVVGRRQQGIQCPEQKPEQPRRDKHQARQQPAGFSFRHAPLACGGNCHFALPPTTLRLAHSMSARHLPGIRHSCIHRTRSAGSADLADRQTGLSSASPDSSIRSRRASAFPRRPAQRSACRGRPSRALPSTDSTGSRAAGSGEAGTNRWCR